MSTKEFKKFKIKTTIVETRVHQKFVLAENKKDALEGKVYKDGSQDGTMYINTGNGMCYSNSVSTGTVTKVKETVEVTEVTE